jgi:hypothetical protein
MTALGIATLQTLSCIGFGAVILNAFRIQKDLSCAEQWIWSFTIGFGLLGWLLFFFGVAGWFLPLPLFSVLGAGTCGIYFLLSSTTEKNIKNFSASFDFWHWLLIAGIGFIGLVDLFEGLSPPADGDTLAYHFALPKYFSATGKLEFIPRAVDGAFPMLAHMTYIPALGLGGERALTLWVMLSGWMTVALVFIIARRNLDLRLSLLTALIFMSTPAVLYGAGSGQVEVRNAGFAIIAAFAVSQAVKHGLLRYSLLAGLMVGFFMGAKFHGLLFAFACGVVILFQKRWLTHGFVLTGIALVAGGQWYIWTYLHTGDPIYPVLFGTLDYLPTALWDAENAASFQTALEIERAVPASISWFLAYPFAATLANIKSLEATRTGFGPYLLLIFPFVIAGAWSFRHRMIQHSMFPFIVITLLFYAIWFFTGSSQRIRFLVPIYPIVLIVCIYTAARWANTKSLTRPFYAAAILTLGIQFAAQTVYGKNYTWYIFSDRDREDFFTRTVSGYAPVSWINTHIKKSEKVFFTARQLVYLFNKPAFYGHWAFEPRIKTGASATDPKRFYRQLIAQKITHLLVYGPLPKTLKDIRDSYGPSIWKSVYFSGCAQPLKHFKVSAYGSRTLSASMARTGQAHVLKLNIERCNQWLKT